MRALVTGATGFVGKTLLSKLDEAVVLSRNVERAQQQLGSAATEVLPWNPIEQTPPAAAFADVDAVFHLAGDPVAEGRWTAAKKKAMRDSRELGTRHLVETMAGLDSKPPVLISASAVGFYGDVGEDEIDENTPAPQDDFLADICIAWEQEAQKAEEFAVRVVNPRIGIVLGPGGGALGKMLTPFKMGMGSALGSGRQWMPWIHRDDLVDLMLYAAKHDALRGPVNAAAPNPVTNRDFTKILGKVLSRPTFMPPVPKFMLHVMFGEFADVLLASQKVMPKAALEAGFEFTYPTLEAALEEIFHGAPAATAT